MVTDVWCRERGAELSLVEVRLRVWIVGTTRMGRLWSW
jgi:hypothetical protein